MRSIIQKHVEYYTDNIMEKK